MAKRFVAETQRRDVYNLTVDGAHEFYANGVLVHNCDSLRYLLVNLGTESGFHFPTSDDSPTPPVLDPNAPHPDTYTPPEVPSIGGFPILQGGGDPWG